MEMLFIVIGLLAFLWIAGLLQPLRVVSSSLNQAASIGERQMAYTNASHKADIVNKYGNLEVSDTALNKAVEVKRVLSSFDI